MGTDVENLATETGLMAQRPPLSAVLEDISNPLTPVMDALLLDAKRYRWIRSQTSHATLLIDGVDEGLALDAMDIAIDEAMDVSSNAEVTGRASAACEGPR